MSPRQQPIVDYLLRHGEATARALADITHAPEPSIRRDLQTLHRQGHNISFADERTGMYRRGAAQSQSVGA